MYIWDGSNVEHKWFFSIHKAYSENMLTQRIDTVHNVESTVTNICSKKTCDEQTIDRYKSYHMAAEKAGRLVSSYRNEKLSVYQKSARGHDTKPMKKLLQNHYIGITLQKL